MTERIRVGVFFGGRSGEHEVSLNSARFIIANLNPEKYEVIQIAITQNGEWYSGEDALEVLSHGNPKDLTPVTLLPEPGHNRIYAIRDGQLLPYAVLDVAFPVLHGTFGEDGTIQGLFEMAGVAYVGAGVLGSSVGMDKALFKSVMRSKGIPVLDSQTFTRLDLKQSLETVISIAEKLSPYPIFTKPANLGSSVGITKCRSRGDLMEGLMEAARFDRRILVERGMEAPHEIEVSVLGNEQPKASIPGEIVPGEDFYTYSAKYISDQSHLVIPAELPSAIIEQIQQTAVDVYKAIDCAGLARVDFLVDRDTHEIFVSEVNTIPGFTRISMYPKLWEASGIPSNDLVERLLELALERKADRDQTEFFYRRSA